MTALLRIILTLLGIALSSAAAAQAYPTKAIRFISPYAPGGTTDIMARLIAAKLNESWGQPVIVENRAGANGNVGADVVAKSAPDGYTILMGAIGPLCINVLMYAKMPYDPLKDLAPVVQTATVPLILVVHPSLPTKNVKEFIALMKARAGQFNYASAGSGSPQHLTAELFKTMAKVDMNHIPYKGSGPALIDLVGGQVPFAFESTIPVLPYIKSGRLRALGITSAQRWPLVPDLPTVADGGVPGFEAITWYGVAAPAAVPADIVKRLNAEITRVLNLPDIKQRLADLGTPMVAGTPEQFGALIRSEVVKWGKVVKQANVKLD